MIRIFSMPQKRWCRPRDLGWIGCFLALCCLLGVVTAFPVLGSASQVQILFDETRLPRRSEGSYEEGEGYDFAIAETAWYGTSVLAEHLREQGYKVGALSERPITSEVLTDADVLLVFEPSMGIPYTPSEILSIRTFVEQGGGLFLTCMNWRGEERPTGGTDPIARAFGVSFKDNGGIQDSSSHYGDQLHIIKISISNEHDVTDEVSSYYFQGTYLDEIGGALVLAESDEESWFDCYGSDNWGDDIKQHDEESGPFPVLAAMVYGGGRIVFAGDAFSLVSNDWIDELDAERLVLNIIEWLSTQDNQPPVAHFTWEVASSNGSRLLAIPDVGYTALFDASLSHDPDSRITKYSWDWDSDGVFDETTTSPVVEHQFSATAPHYVTLRVHDDRGSTNDITLTEHEAAQYWYGTAQEAYDTGSGTGRKDAEEAIIGYQTAIALWPEYLEALNQLGWVLAQEERINEAIQAFDDLISVSKDPLWTAWAWVSQSRIYATACMLEEAEDSILQALEVQPDMYQVHHQLGWIHFRYGRYDEALAEFQRALELGTSEYEAQYAIAVVYAYKGDDDDAVNLLQGLRTKKPDDARIPNLLGGLNFWQGKFDEALSLFQESLEIAHFQGATAPGTQCNLGWTYFYTEQWQKAIDAVQRALELATDPTPSVVIEANTCLGRAYSALGEQELAHSAFAEAVEVAEMALACNPYGRDMHADLGFCYWGLADLGIARRYFEEALELSHGDATNDVVAREVREYLDKCISRVDFTFHLLNGETNQFQLVATVLGDTVTTICRYEWDWDSDGSYDIAVEVPGIMNRFSGEGPYRVTLTVIDAQGNRASCMKEVGP